jgi:xylan 1,4-beta-xylosidase
MHDYTPAATFVVKANLESIGLVDSLAYWTFTDVFEEHGAGNSIFHGGFGMINFQGIVKPTFHAYRMLGSLGDELLASTTGGVVTRHKQTGKITALLYHYPEEVKTAAPSSFKTRNIAEATLKIGSSDQCQLIISGLQADTTWEIQTLGIGSGDAITAWRDMGMPEPPSREQTRELKTLAESLRQEIAHANANGELQLNLSLNPWDVVLVQQL